MSLLKNREFAMMVSYAFLSKPFWGEIYTRVLMRVRELRLLPGSLNAMCPSGPIPSNQHCGFEGYRTAKEQLDSSDLPDFFLVFLTFGFQVFGISV